MVKRVKIDIPREFIKRSLKYNELERGIAGIKETIKDFDKKPILNLEINDVESDTNKVYELIKEGLDDLSLMIRPKFNMLDEEGEDIRPGQIEGLGPKELIEEKLKGYSNEDVTHLGTDLYDFLSRDKIDESEELIDQFFKEYYQTPFDSSDSETDEIIKDDETPKEEPKDVQIKFKEALE